MEEKFREKPLWTREMAVSSSDSGNDFKMEVPETPEENIILPHEEKENQVKCED